MSGCCGENGRREELRPEEEGEGSAPSEPQPERRGFFALSGQVWALLGGLALIVLLAGALFLIPAPRAERVAKMSSPDEGGGYTKENCVADECLAVDGLSYPVAPLPREMEETLLRSLDDTYTAIALYTGALDRLGAVVPFINIVRTEQHYLAALKALFDKYGVAIPENDKFSRALPPEGISLTDACATLLEFERRSVAQYENTLLPRAAQHPDIMKVFTALARASRELHVPALARCAERPSSPAQGA